jgi:hypothetical protein
MLLAGFAALTVSAVQASTPSSAAGVVNSFYRWYFSVNTTRAGWRGHFSEARPYLDPSLYNLVTKMLAEEKRSQGVALDFDPFINAQMPATSFTVGTPSSSKTPTQIPVAFGFGKAPDRTHVTVVVRKSGAWQIENFMYASNGDLRSIIQKQL